MNKRAQQRLLGVTAILILGMAALFLAARGATPKTVEEVANATDLAGERITVSGTVVSGSWDKNSDPMTFEIRAEEDKEGTGAVITIKYWGMVPSAFGDGVVANIDGEYVEEGGVKFVKADRMVTKCPSKYESQKDALTVSSLLKGGDAMVGTTTKIVGYIKAGTLKGPEADVRFILTNDATGGDELPVAFTIGTPDGVAEGTKVVLQGALEKDGVYAATSVAIEKSE